MDISICSYSFHRALRAGKQTIFDYIEISRQLGCTRLDPWRGHFLLLVEGDEKLFDTQHPLRPALLTPEEEKFLQQVKQAADRASLPIGCIAADRCHIYDPSEDVRRVHREKALRWIEAARQVGAQQIRIDAGGPARFTDDVFEIVIEGYKDLVERGRQAGVEVLTENHFGPSLYPDQVLRLLDSVPGLGLLLDSFNWAHGKQGEGWKTLAGRAKYTHIKTFHFTTGGEELTQNIPSFCRLMRDSGYQGAWGIESVPREEDEIDAVRKTIALIRHSL
jgi:sugar phosphate isomerase/epimerase